jgi:hypothetical protein
LAHVSGYFLYIIYNVFVVVAIHFYLFLSLLVFFYVAVYTKVSDSVEMYSLPHSLLILHYAGRWRLGGLLGKIAFSSRDAPLPIIDLDALRQLDKVGTRELENLRRHLMAPITSAIHASR